VLQTLHPIKPLFGTNQEALVSEEALVPEGLNLREYYHKLPNNDPITIAQIFCLIC
jgi:hypothetical protein